MALDQEYFDSISIDVVKKKYYNANKVHAVLEDIRVQAAALTAENKTLREQLEAMNSRKDEIGDTLMSAQGLARQIIASANERADAIIAEAERQREAQLALFGREQERAARNMEECIDELKQEHLKCIDLLNARLQQYLCALELPDMPEAKAEPEAEEEPEAPESAKLDGMPSAAELEERVAAIARELKEIIG